ncbi:MAG TPA: tetratricopeptide repeat protein, partial [Planctomycetota bacterium]|nr:tetratricopeptide repeat protein [Planctomycetota bacterium]
GREVEGREVAQRAALAARANGDHLREAEAMVVLGRLGLESGDVSPAIVALSTAAEAARSAGAIAVQIEAWTYLAQAYGKAGNHASAQGVLDLAFAAWRSHPDPRLEARLLLQRGIHHGRSGRFEDSRRDLERSLSLDMQALGPDAQSHRAAHLNLSICLRRLGRLEEALAHSRRQLALARLLGDEHPGVARAGREVGVVLSAMGRYEQALAEYQRAGAVYRKAYGEQNEGVSSVESSLGTLYSRMGRWREALAHARTAYAIRQAIGGDVAAGLMLKHNLGSELVMVGEVAEGERLLREVLAERIRQFGPSHPDVASTSGELCGAIFYAGRVDEALRQCEEARRLFAT